MTLDEAKRIAAIAGTADDGCATCVQSMVDLLNHQFPEFSWSYNIGADEKVQEIRAREVDDDASYGDDVINVRIAYKLEIGAAQVSVEPRGVLRRIG